MKYKITKKVCQEQIDKRSPVVCTGCGGEIEPIKTVDNSGDPTYWSGCNKCHCFDNGTQPKIHEIAKTMVDKNRFRAYSHDPEPPRESKLYDYWRTSQIRGTARIVTDILILSK